MTTPKTPENEKTKTATADAAGAATKEERRDTESSRAETDRMPRTETSGARSYSYGGVPRISDEEERPHFLSDLHRDNYYRDLDLRQKKRDEAWRAVPPGTRIRVATARGIPSRRRAGIDFTPTAVTVEVVDVSDTVLAKQRADFRAAQSLDPVAARAVRAVVDPGLVVGPEGAKEILDDDGLSTFRFGAGTQAESADERVQDLEHQLAAMRAERDRLLRDRTGASPADASSNPFGSDLTPKPEGRLSNPTRRST